VIDPAGTLEKALERNLLNVKHERPLPLLVLTLGELLVDLSNSRRPAFQGVGSDLAGAIQCNDEGKL